MVTTLSSLTASCLILCSCFSYTLSQSPTYADLALALTPLQFSFAITQMRYLDDMSQPDDVKNFRMNLLYAREAIDIFAYAYPRQNANEAGSKISSLASKGSDTRTWHNKRSLMSLTDTTTTSAQNIVEHDDDLLLVIRRDLDEGYEVLGNFQDLAHSQVHYEPSDVELLRSKCLVWQERFVQDMEARSYLTFLHGPSKNQLHGRPLEDISKLFWGFKGAHPHLHLSGYANMALLLSSLAEEAGGDALTQLLQLPQVYEEPQHSQFHLYRKLIRSLLAVVHFFPSIIIPESVARMRSLEETSSSQEVSTNRGYYAVVKDLVPARLRAWSQSSWVPTRLSQIIAGTFMKITSPVNDLSNLSTHHHKCQHHEDNPSGDDEAAADSLMDMLQTVFHDMGQVNNIVIAYQFYMDHGLEQQTEQQRLLVLEEWGKVSTWLRQQHLPSLLSCFAQTIKTQWDL